MASKPNGNSNGRGRLRLYRSYNYVDKDPAIDKLRTIVGDEKVSETNLAILSGVSRSTIDNWFNGKTRRPQHTTLAAAAAALGYDWELTHSKTIDFKAELPKAVRWHERQAEAAKAAKKK
jgi:transcriptional regulator with XRE-family HTH domain